MTVKKLIVAALALLITGCGTLPVEQVLPFTAGAYYYERFDHKINSDNTVALLSYASADFYKRGYIQDFESIEEIEEFFSDYYDAVVDIGQISPNYPVQATAEELHIVQVFTDRWISYAKALEYTPKAAYFDFSKQSAMFIQYIQSNEYEKNRSNNVVEL